MSYLNHVSELFVVKLVQDYIIGEKQAYDFRLKGLFYLHKSADRGFLPSDAASSILVFLISI